MNSVMTSDPVTGAVLPVRKDGCSSSDEAEITDDCKEVSVRAQAAAEPCTDQTDEYLCTESPRLARGSGGCAENGGCAGTDQGGKARAATTALDGHACTDTWNCPKSPPCYKVPASDLEEAVPA